MRTYGDLLEFAKSNYFYELPGITARDAENIRTFIEFAEEGNEAVFEAAFRTLKAMASKSVTATPSNSTEGLFTITFVADRLSKLAKEQVPKGRE